ncbi:hypothetical protein Tco_0912441 [Tanacetum coccineum]
MFQSSKKEIDIVQLGIVNQVELKLLLRISAGKEVDIGLDGGVTNHYVQQQICYFTHRMEDLMYAVTLLKQIWKFSMAQDIGAGAAINIFNSISSVIAKGVGAQIVYRLSFNLLEKDVVTLLKWIQKFSMAQDIGAHAAIYIFSRISFSIAKGVRTHIVSRLSSNLL